MTTFQDMLRSVIVRINDGTGFFISDTYIVTAYHVVESEKTKINRGKSFNIYIKDNIRIYSTLYNLLYSMFCDIIRASNIFSKTIVS